MWGQESGLRQLELPTLVLICEKTMSALVVSKPESISPQSLHIFAHLELVISAEAPALPCCALLPMPKVAKAWKTSCRSGAAPA